MPHFRLNYPFNRESWAVSEELHSTISESYACPVSHIHSHPMTRNPVHINLSEIMWPCNSQTTLTWRAISHFGRELSHLFLFSSSPWNPTQVESPRSVFLTLSLINNCSAVLFDIQITLFPLYFHSRHSLEWYYLTFNEHNRVWHHLLYGWIQKLFAHIPEQIFPGAQMHLIY